MVKSDGSDLDDPIAEGSPVTGVGIVRDNMEELSLFSSAQSSNRSMDISDEDEAYYEEISSDAVCKCHLSCRHLNEIRDLGVSRNGLLEMIQDGIRQYKSITKEKENLLEEIKKLREEKEKLLQESEEEISSAATDAGCKCPMSNDHLFEIWNLKDSKEDHIAILHRVVMRTRSIIEENEKLLEEMKKLWEEKEKLVQENEHVMDQNEKSKEAQDTSARMR